MTCGTVDNNKKVNKILKITQVHKDITCACKHVISMCRVDTHHLFAVMLAFPYLPFSKKQRITPFATMSNARISQSLLILNRVTVC